MDDHIKQKIKEDIKNLIRTFFKNKKNKKIKSYQVLDDIFPNERRIRSLIGGLETSLGTTFWEPISKTLAEINGFESIKDKILVPTPFPQALQNELAKYEIQKSKLSHSPLDIAQDIWVENEFWDFCSGTENTFEQLKAIFVELGQENFAAEFNDIFYQN